MDGIPSPLFKPPALLHGGDYNPEQWLKYPGIIPKDFALFSRAKLNSITVGVFSWSTLEPSEGQYNFEWLDQIFEQSILAKTQVILATPSGAKPNWLAHEYPEVRRVTWEGQREQQHGRHNHCPTSPIYREKVRAINAQLSMRYGRHPALSLWHISNEYGGYCYCELCKHAFRDWLMCKYASLDQVNEAWWSRFWSHTYTSWDQIDCIDWSVNGLVRDWKLFMTYQLRTFIRNEIGPLRQYSPNVAVTTNMMPSFESYDYWKIAQEIDVISWDGYPSWHTVNSELNESEVAIRTAFHHDAFRSLKNGNPFLLMETTPSQVNYYPFCPLKRPGVHRLTALQAVAHGADAVCYFQMRKSRGSAEQFHGAVIDHVGHSDTRVFREVASVGETLEKLSPIRGGRSLARVALMYDWESRWALELAGGPQTQNRNYFETVISFYRPFWRRGIPVDIVHPESNLEAYALVLAPMIFLTNQKIGHHLTDYVEAGGTLISTYHTGVVDEHARAHLGGMPGHLKELFGVWVEEADALPEVYQREIEAVAGSHGLSGRYKTFDYQELIRITTAKAIAVYAHDFYAGQAAATVRQAGDGKAFYLAARTEPKFQDDLLDFLVKDLGIRSVVNGLLPHGVSVQQRSTAQATYLFIMNFTAKPCEVTLPTGQWGDAEKELDFFGPLSLEGFGARVLFRNH